MTSCKVTRYIVSIPRLPGFYAPHGHRVSFTNRGEATRYLGKCCESCKLLTIPAGFSR